MKVNKAAPLLAPILAALAVAALALYAYRGLAERPFAADDYQWLLGVRDLSLGALLRRAFDPAAQAHFFRPLVWLLFWAQTRAFGLDPRGFHAVSLALHLLNALLIGWLAYRLQIEKAQFAICNIQFTIAMAIVALHPAPFEAVVWISAQSELLAATLLLAALLLWTIDDRQSTIDDRHHDNIVYRLWSIVFRPWSLLATLALGLALLAKESAVIGLPLLMLLGAGGSGTRHRKQGTTSESSGVTSESSGTTSESLGTASESSGVTSESLGAAFESLGTAFESLGTTSESQGTTSESQGTTSERQGTTFESQGTAFKAPGTTFESQGTASESQGTGIKREIAHSTLYTLQSIILAYLLPTLLTIAYIALQVFIERRNYLLAQGGYGLGTQVVLNPLRSLALIVAPLPGTEHADASWLVPVGAAVAIALFLLLIRDVRLAAGVQQTQSSVVNHRSSVGLILALALTLLPTAPFASPPDSRYLYLPVMAAALLVTAMSNELRVTSDGGHARRLVTRYSSLVTVLLALALIWWASGELHTREGRFAAASGPGGSLWHVATAACADARPDRMVIVEPPIAPPHVEAIVGLACGPDVRTKIVGPDQIEGAIKGHTIVIAFPNGSADIQRRT